MSSAIFFFWPLTRSPFGVRVSANRGQPSSSSTGQGMVQECKEPMQAVMTHDRFGPATVRRSAQVRVVGNGGCLVGKSAIPVLGFHLHQDDHVSDSLQALCFRVVDIEPEGIFEGHDGVDRIEAGSAEILDNARLGHNPVRCEAELGGDHVAYNGFYVLHGSPFLQDASLLNERSSASFGGAWTAIKWRRSKGGAT
ncbi:hypothetical protein [Reyranella massiliensis]|uniref:hypothetical protein n=1 Tax=Reyranella massiliensis TaxID=445220 RepID=UPI003CCAF37A